jgi:acyl-homoserine-lactone acylase
MRMQARSSSSFTYADARGNIFYVWNATLPALPHAPGGDTVAISARHSSEVWPRLVPWDSLPQLLNPRSGYLHNENDSPHFTNAEQLLDASRFPPNHERPRLGLRSQLALELLHSQPRFSLEEVVRLKHSPRMLLADRVKADLLIAARRAAPDAETLRALHLIEHWDNTTAPESRGGVLFESWWRRYTSQAGGAPFREPWTEQEPTTTPIGLARPDLAAEAFAWAVRDTQQRFGSWDVEWGAVHRVRRGGVDVPVAGCSGVLGLLSGADLSRGHRWQPRGERRRRVGPGGGIRKSTPCLLGARVWAERPAGFPAPRRSGGDVRPRGDEASGIHGGRRPARDGAPLPPRSAVGREIAAGCQKGPDQAARLRQTSPPATLGLFCSANGTGIVTSGP